jgi:hypothetical protein
MKVSPVKEDSCIAWISHNRVLKAKICLNNQEERVGMDEDLDKV